MVLLRLNFKRKLYCECVQLRERLQFIGSSNITLPSYVAELLRESPEPGNFFFFSDPIQWLVNKSTENDSQKLLRGGLGDRVIGYCEPPKIMRLAMI